MAKELRMMVYDKESVDEAQDVPLAAAIERIKEPGIGWVTIYSPTEEDYALLESELELHSLALEDTKNERQRPKVEAFPSNTYIVARSLHREADGTLVTGQTNLFFGGSWVLVIHERPLGLFDPVRDRIRRGRPRIRSAGADYLAYALLDAVVDTYFPVLEDLADRIEDAEELVTEGQADDAMLETIHEIRHDLRRIRRHIWPARDAMATLLRDEVPGIKKSTTPFLRDVHDHVVQAIDLVETDREAAASLMDLYLTVLSNKTNDIMKVLTIVATIFIPITFVAGVYGMNFDTTHPYNMPELSWAYGYPAFLALTGSVMLTMLVFFRRRGWL